MDNYGCIDIGGTNIKYGLITEGGEIVTSNEMPTCAWEGGPGILERCSAILEELQQDRTLSGICVSTAGVVDWKKGTILHAADTIPNYKGTNIKDVLEEKFSIPCEVENDVNCAALGEYYYGAGKGYASCLCLTIGTGIGGAFVQDGSVFHGHSYSGCEVGYLHLPGGEFQKLGASSILVQNVQKRMKDGTKIDGRYIFENAKKGDTICLDAIDEMVDVLGMGIANICYILNPEVVVLGGGIMAQEEYLYQRLNDSLQKYLIPYISEKTTLTFAKNQNQAGMLGALRHFLSIHQSN